MQLLYNDPLCYPANGHSGLRGGRCWLRLYGEDRRNVAVVTELDSNDGPSVTNAIESIRALVLVLGGRHIPLTVVEHYDDRVSYGITDGRIRLGQAPTRYSRVDFDAAGHPSWYPLSPDEVDALLGVRIVELPEAAR